jgi:hypothetical protein
MLHDIISLNPLFTNSQTNEKNCPILIPGIIQ